MDFDRKANGYLMLKRISVLIIFAGTALRLAEWLHCRDLMMDEVNVVRNIFERNFAGLWDTLDYEQFAPPLFLWAVKITTSLFGYGEMAVRVFPVLCSCIALYAFYKWLADNEGLKAAWYVLSLFAFSFIYIQYANDVKQYASDSLAAILILAFAFRDFKSEKTNRQFFTFWSVTGAVAVWASMPGVFVLAGAGISFFILALRKKQYAKLWSITGAGAVWILHFSCYYYILLRHQVSSGYLQSFHEYYFLKIHSFTDLINDSNQLLLKEAFIACTGNRNEFMLYFNAALFFSGLIFLFRKGVEYGLAVMIPVAALLVASALHLYTLLPRVCIFIMPVVLFVMGYGLTFLISTLRWRSIPLIIAALTGVYHSQQWQLFHRSNRIEIDELNTEIAFAGKHQVSYDQIYLHPLYTPNLLYYQTIHPDKERGEKYQQIQLMYAPYPVIREQIKDRAAFIYFWMDDFTMQQHRDSVFSYLQPVDSLVRPSYKVLVFEKGIQR